MAPKHIGAVGKPLQCFLHTTYHAPCFRWRLLRFLLVLVVVVVLLFFLLLLLLFLLVLYCLIQYPWAADAEVSSDASFWIKDLGLGTGWTAVWDCKGRWTARSLSAPAGYNGNTSLLNDAGSQGRQTAYQNMLQHLTQKRLHQITVGCSCCLLAQRWNI